MRILLYAIGMLDFILIELYVEIKLKDTSSRQKENKDHVLRIRLQIKLSLGTLLELGIIYKKKCALILTAT